MCHELACKMAQLLQHAPQGWQPPVSTSISPCLAPMGIWPQGCLTPSGPCSCASVHNVSQSSSALTPPATDEGSHTQHRECKGKQSHALRAYLLDKTARHFCLLSVDEWSCLGSRSHSWPQEPFTRAYPLIPGRNCPPASHHPHLPLCRGGIGFMGHCRIGSITLFPLGVRPSNAKGCCLLQDFMVFPTLHSSFVHLPVQHWQTTKGNL